MKASIAIVASALATQSFAGAALYMMECAGGSALLYIKGWSWEGGLKDKEEFDKTPPEDEECELDGSSTDGDCEIRDYKFHISGSAPDGCHSALDVTEGRLALVPVPVPC